MSMQAGIWHYDGRPVSRAMAEAFDRQLSSQGPDGSGRYEEPGLTMLHHAFWLTEEDSLEIQPNRGPHGCVLTWDGRLDNRDELIAWLGRSAVELPTDADIVDAALAAWGSQGLPRLVGDWALAWWNPRERRLLIARDYLGVRNLYYLATKTSFYWSTDIATLVLHCGERHELCDEYFAGYFTTNPEAHLTPYEEIKLVPPGGYLEANPHTRRVRRYWSFNGISDIRFKTDREYEEQLRWHLRVSVKRRLRTRYPILADLSGGLDSSSIVCMAYDILRAGEASAVINTLSKFSLEEPGADERLYFAAVEEFIGKVGTHLEIRLAGTKLLQALPDPFFAALPGYFDRALEGERNLLSRTGKQGNRVHLSGLGGDEILGGLQNPVPELAEYLWKLDLASFTRQIQAWALQRKTTVWSLLWRSSSYLMPAWLRERLGGQEMVEIPGWLRKEFAKKPSLRPSAIRSAGAWAEWFPGPPSKDSSYLTLAASIAGSLPRFTFVEQQALPFYDRDLVQFILALPDEQLLRPHQRRSLMRRALKGIVPDIVLERKTKWLGRRVPHLQMLENANTFASIIPSTSIAARYVDSANLNTALDQLSRGEEVPALPLERLLSACLLYQKLDEVRLWKAPALTASGGQALPLTVLDTRERQG